MRKSEMSTNTKMRKSAADIRCILENGSKAEIFNMLEHKINLECMYKKNDTVYHVILRNKKLTEQDIIAISQIFRDCKINPNDRNRRMIAPLHLAIINRMTNVTDFFISCRRSNYAARPNNDTLTLFFVEDENNKFWETVNQKCGSMELWNSEKIENESARFLEWLISREFDFDRNNNKSHNSVNLAVFRNLHHISHILLSRSMNIRGHLSADILLERFLYRNACARRRNSYKKSSKLWYSNYTTRYADEIVKILIDRGALKLRWKNNIRLAIKVEEDIAIIKLLLDHIPDEWFESDFSCDALNDLMGYPCTEVSASEMKVYLQILHFLLAKGAELNKNGESQMCPVQTAVMAKNIHALRWLDETNTNFKVLTNHGKNLLHLLLDEERNENDRQIALFDFLISRGCQINARDSNGTSPLHLAAKHDNLTLISKLIEQGSEVNCRDNNMRTPLHYSVVDDKAVDSTELLLRNGANVHSIDSYGKTALLLAVSTLVEKCMETTIKVLLKYGAQVEMLNGINDEMTLRTVGVNVTSNSVDEFLKYGLDVNNSYFCHRLYHYVGGADALFEKHCIKLKTAKLHCSEDYSFLSGDDKYQGFHQQCLKDIETLKTTFVDSRTSLYDFLHLNLDRKRVYINNEKFKKLMNSPKLEKEFPRYYVLILAGYRKAEARKLQLERAKTVWYDLTDISLPDICTEHIISYLNDAELVIMINVG